MKVMGKRVDETVEVKLQGLRRELRQLEATKADAEKRFKEALAALPHDIERQIQRVMKENDRRKDLFNKIVHEQMDIRCEMEGSGGRRNGSRKRKKKLEKREKRGLKV